MKEATIREILRSNPTTLDDAKQAARRLEVLEKEHERLWRKEDQRIPSFIPIQAQDPSFQGYNPSTTIQFQPHVQPSYPIPLDVRLPPPMPTLPAPISNKDWKDELHRE